jgi:RHS repeat-associated protein
LTTCTSADARAWLNYPFLTQKERDNETGLDYFGARYHASVQGRFTSSDPLITSGKVEVPQSWNRYTYCVNNPLAFVDPTGLEWRTNDGSGALRWYEKDDDRTGSTEYTNEYYQNGNQWVRLNIGGPTHNTEDADLIQIAISGCSAPECSAQKSGVGQVVRPVSFFIHESTENLAFARQGRGFYNYQSAHAHAINREAVLRRELRITGGFAGGVIDTRIPKK